DPDHLLGLDPSLVNPATRPYVDQRLGAVQVFGYQDVLSVLTDTDRYSQEYASGPAEGADPGWEHPTLWALWSKVGQEHHDLRHAVAEPFGPREIDKLTATIQSLTEDLVRDITRSGQEFEVMSALATPLPARVIAHIMGVDTTEDAKFVRWVTDFA